MAVDEKAHDEIERQIAGASSAFVALHCAVFKDNKLLVCCYQKSGILSFCVISVSHKLDTQLSFTSWYH